MSRLFLYLTLFLLVGATSCKKDKDSTPSYERGIVQCYEVKEGNHAFQPYSLSKDRFSPDGNIYLFSVEVVFQPNCIYDWGNDGDRFDWNKLDGMSFDWRVNNKNSLIPAWRCSNGETIDVVTYQNKEYGFFPGKKIVTTVRPNEKVLFEYYCYKDEKKITSIITHKGVVYEEDFIFNNDINFFYLFDPWHGGANNAEGEFGGVASQNMDLCTTVTIKSLNQLIQ
jgi:hypothetical protein